MADYNMKLSQLHQQAVQAQLQLLATIDEHGWVHFKHPDLGELTINLREYTPEGMNLSCRIFEDFTDTAPAPEDLMRICDGINKLPN